MNNTSTAFKRFLGNKNTVTILGTLVMVMVIYIGYNARIKAATQPQVVAFAKVTIQPRTKITPDMIGTMPVPLAMVDGRENIIIDPDEIVGRYTNVNTLIPAYSLFYKEAILERSALPDVAVLEVKDGEVLFNLPVSVESTYGNSLYPGNYFDIYYKSVDDEKKIQYGKLISNVKILAVKDRSGNNVFENSEEFKTPSMLIFAVPDNLNLLLRKGLYLTAYNAEVVPVPVRETKVTKNMKPTLVSNYLASFINSKTVNVPIDQILTETTTNNYTEETTTETQ